MIKERNDMNVIDIAFTCYPVTDLQRARRFYEGVLGLKEARFFGEGDKGSSNMTWGRTRSASETARRIGNRLQAAGRSLLKWRILTPPSRNSKRMDARSASNRWRHPCATWPLCPTRMEIPF